MHVFVWEDSQPLLQNRLMDVYETHHIHKDVLVISALGRTRARQNRSQGGGVPY